MFESLRPDQRIKQFQNMAAATSGRSFFWNGRITRRPRAHRVIAAFLTKRAGLKRTAADTSAVTLIQRFGSAANLNLHLHCLVLGWPHGSAFTPVALAMRAYFSVSARMKA